MPLVAAGFRCRSCGICCAPLVRGVTEAALIELVEHARRTFGLRSIEVRDRLVGPDGWIVSQGHWHELRLSPGPAELYAHFHKTRVRQVLGRADREGIVVERGECRRDLCEGRSTPYM